LLPDKHVAYNRSGEAEMVTTLDQLKTIVAAAGSGGDTYGDIYITLDAKNVKDWQDVVNVVNGLRKTARSNGGNVRYKIRD
jgi:hypothetical protein